MKDEGCANAVFTKFEGLKRVKQMEPSAIRRFVKYVRTEFV